MNKMKEIVSLCKRRGIIFQSGEIYGGLSNAWDYGPIGIEMKNNIKKEWWKSFVHQREDVVGIDSTILTLPKVLEASGHVQSFHDKFIDCKECKKRFRLDELISYKYGKEDVDKFLNQADNIWIKENLNCIGCKKSHFTDLRDFNLMFKTYQGALKDESSLIYLRPETAQGIFLNYKRVKESIRKSLPFGIAQIGKSFRNEITPGHFTFRTREFEQMEIEYFLLPNEYEKYFDEWVEDSKNWYINLGMTKDHLRIREHAIDELSHYSKHTVDIEYKFPFGWGELQGIAYRGDFDLSQHQMYSKENLKYKDENGKEYIPHVIEPSFGLDRCFLAFILDSYEQDNDRVFLKIHPKIAGIKVAVFPLKRNNPEMVSKARKIFDQLSLNYNTYYDDRGSIGKLYRRQDEIGTPFCITIDYFTQQDNKVTIRERNTMKQERVGIMNLNKYFENQFD